MSVARIIDIALIHVSVLESCVSCLFSCSGNQYHYCRLENGKKRLQHQVPNISSNINSTAEFYKCYIISLVPNTGKYFYLN